MLIWSFFRLPEPKGLSPSELDVLFDGKVGARKFNSTRVDPFRSEHLQVTPFDEKNGLAHSHVEGA